MNKKGPFYDILKSSIEDMEMSLTIIDQKDSVDFEIESWTPMGGDKIMDLVMDNDFTPKDFMSELSSYIDNFDVDYETYIWLDDNGHGKNGAPYEMADLLKDNEDYLEMLKDLYSNLNFKLKEKNII